MLNALLAHAPQLTTVPRAGIVHRLDKDTSGLLVIAKTLTAQTDLVRQLQARTVTREYRAVAHGKRHPRRQASKAPSAATPRSRSTYGRGRHSGKAGSHPLHQYWKNWRAPACSPASLETGRTHQIRVHLQKLGHPIWGDPVYGPA